MDNRVLFIGVCFFVAAVGGCVGGGTEYVCPDGSTVGDRGLCPKPATTSVPSTTLIASATTIAPATSITSTTTTSTTTLVSASTITYDPVYVEMTLKKEEWHYFKGYMIKYSRRLQGRGRPGGGRIGFYVKSLDTPVIEIEITEENSKKENH